MAEKYLNLYGAIGGNRKKWETDAKITMVELNQKIANVYIAQHPNDEVIIGDAMEYVKKHRNDFSFVWASPPCQKHSRMMKATRHDVADFFDLQLYQLIIFLEHFYNGYWVVENVKPYYKPLIEPTAIIGRHYFWSNFPIDENFKSPEFKNFITAGTAKETDKLKQWLGINYEGNIYYDGNHCPGQVLRNAVHPDLGLHIFNCFEKAKAGGQKINCGQLELNFD